MGKKMNLTKNNKGAALVSVLIAISFITILASSMLYMSFQNFKMKASMNSSQDNFYETEKCMNIMATRVRNNLYNAGSDAKVKLADYCTDTNCVNYSCDKLTNCVFPGKSKTNLGDGTVRINNPFGDGDNYIIGTGSGSQVIDESTDGFNIYRLKDVKITQISKDGFENSVQSDIVVKTKTLKSTEDAGGVGECSMLLDGPLSVSPSMQDFNILSLYGNAYVANAVCTGTQSVPGSYTNNTEALHLRKEMKLNVIGDYMVVYGDVVLDDSSCICLYGSNFTVYGDIYLNGNSSLIFSKNAKVYMVKDFELPGRAVGTSSQIIPNGSLQKHVYPVSSVNNIQSIDSTQFAQFMSSMHYDDNIANNDGITNQIVQPITVGGKQITYKDVRNLTNWDTKTYCGQQCGARFNTQDTINGECNNMLVFNIKAGNVTVREPNTHATIISDTPILIDQQHNVVLTKLGSDVFNFISRKSTEADCQFIKTNVETTKGVKIPKLSPGDFFTDDCNDCVNMAFSTSVNGGGDGGTEVTYSSVLFENWVKDKE